MSQWMEPPNIRLLTRAALNRTPKVPGRPLTSDSCLLTPSYNYSQTKSRIGHGKAQS